MKTIGILGGLTWHSTLEYYRIINEYIADEKSGRNSAKILIQSLNFEEFYKLQKNNRFNELNALIKDNLLLLENSGADFTLIASNTAHNYIENINTTRPFIHIADTAANFLIKRKISKVGLLGTRITLTSDFYLKELRKHTLEVILPSESSFENLDEIIFEELAKGIISEKSMLLLRTLFFEFKANGAEAVLLACTELIFPAKEIELPLPYFDSARIHAEYAAKFSLDEL